MKKFNLDIETEDINPPKSPTNADKPLTPTRALNRIQAMRTTTNKNISPRASPLSRMNKSPRAAATPSARTTTPRALEALKAIELQKRRTTLLMRQAPLTPKQKKDLWRGVESSSSEEAELITKVRQV